MLHNKPTLTTPEHNFRNRASNSATQFILTVMLTINYRQKLLSKQKQKIM